MQRSAMKIKLLAFLLLLVASVSAQVVPGSGGVGGTITGQIQTATGGSINNGTLTFTLSQPAIVSNTAIIATTTVSCYTSAAGNIVGVPDPLVLPIVSVNLASGTLPAGNYFVKLYYTSANGNSISSPEVQVSLVSQGTLIVNAPANQPPSATGYGVAISTTSGAEVIQGTATGWSQFQQTQPLLAGSPAPTVNTSSCNIYFSDQLVPTGTNYSVNLVNKNGAKVAGFPQTWCTYGGAGGVINVSQGAPTGNCNTTGVFYPTPIFSNLQTGITQSVSGPLIFSGPINFSNGVTFSGGISFPGTLSFTALASLTAPAAASTGAIELASTDQMCWRNSGNTSDICLGKNASDIFTVGAGAIFSGSVSSSLFTGAAGAAVTVQPNTIAGPGPSLTIKGGDAHGGGSALGGALILGAGGGTGAAFPQTIQLLSGFGSYENIPTVNNGIPSEFAGVDLQNQNAAITGPVTLYTTPFGIVYSISTSYRISWYAKVTTAAGVSSTLGPLTITYTDFDGVAQTITAGALTSAGAVATTSTGNTTTTVLLGIPMMFNPKAGTVIGYTFGYASSAANVMNYTLHIRLEAI